jgi:hypothetical protein
MRHRNLALTTSVLLAAVILVLVLQTVSGAYVSDFSSDEDEPAHVVSSLAVRDYLASGFPHNPLAFGERYYVHYPKVAIGHWPPLFYTVEAAWMLAFGRSRVALEAAVGMFAAALLLSVFFWVRRGAGTAAAMVSALALLAPKFIQNAISQVSPDIALALLCFWAAAFLGEYLDRKRRRDVILFILFSASAIGVHGRGAVLILLPFAVVLIGPFVWTRVRVAALLVCLAILIAVPILLSQAWPFQASQVLSLAILYPRRLGTTMSWPLAALAVLGTVVAIRTPGEPRRWLAMPSLIISGWVFHSLVNAGWTDHYLISAAPAAAALSGRGLGFCMDALRSAFARALLAGAVCGFLIWTALPLTRKPDLGYHRMKGGIGRVDLIAGNALHEGAFIAEMALRDKGLSHFVVRGYKVLASASWLGSDYQLRYSTPAQVLAGLDQMRVETVLVEQASTLPHVVLLLDALRSPAWRDSHPDGLPQGVLAFDRTVQLEPGDPVIHLDMRNRLGRMLEVGPDR